MEQSESGVRILARRLARELLPVELDLVAGGWPNGNAAGLPCTKTCTETESGGPNDGDCDNDTCISMETPMDF